MKKIQLSVLRGLWSIKGRAIAIVATIAVGVGVCAGLFSAMESILYTQEALYQETHFGDLQVSFIPEDVKNLPSFSSIGGIDKVERRLVFPGITRLKDGKRLPTLLVFLERNVPQVNSLKLLSGTHFASNDLDGVVIERGLADYQHYAVGDPIEIQVGERRYEFGVRGVAFSPEYLTASSNPDYFIPEKGALGVAYANIGKVSDALGFTMVNELVFTFTPGANPTEVKAAVLDRLAGLNLERIMPRENHFSYKFLQMDLSSMRRFVPALVLVLAALAFLLTLLTFNRLVAAERREIGVMLALGYGRWTILWSYALAGLALGIAGSVLGGVLSLGVRAAYAQIYAGALGLPQPMLRVYPSILAGAVLVGVASAVLSSVVPGLRLLFLGRRGTPQEIIREAPRMVAADRGPTRRLSAWAAVGPVGWRYGVRNLLRRRGLTASLIGSMGLALAVPISYWIAVDSIRGTVASTFDREHWDLAVDFLYPVYMEDILDVSQVSPGARTEPYFRSSVELWKDSRLQICGLLGIQPDSAMKTVRLIRGRMFEPRARDQIVVSKDLVEKLGVDIGSVIAVKVRETRYPFTIVGITSEIMIGQSMVSLDTARAILGYPEKASGIYVSGVSNTDALAGRLYSHEYVGKVTNRKQMADNFLALLAEITKLVGVAAAFSIFVALLFVFTSLNITISEQEREYATLKALGFGRKTLASIVLTEAWSQAVIGALLSLPLALGIARFLTHRMGQTWFLVELFVTPLNFAGIVGPALLLIPIFARPGIQSIFNLPISRALSTKLME